MTYSILFSSHRLLKILEITAVVLVLLALVYPKFAARWFAPMERRFKALAACRWQAILLSAAFPLTVRFLMLPWYPAPPPQIHDEFSYLLQADTFAHGRVANPVPPYWEHFETEYTLLQPTYASQYQPAQGLVLAAGQVVLRHPWWGVFFSVGIMCATLCWALGFVVPPVWALAGALGAGLQFGIFGLWMNSYFGGAVSATAGALVLGAIERMRRPGRGASSSALAAAGIILLFATRPFEALLWMGVFGCAVVWHGRSLDRRLARGILPAFVVVFSIGSGALAWYNWRITGDPLNPPYLAYRNVYGTPQPYWWQGPIKIANFRHEELKNNYLNQERLYKQRTSLTAVVDAERTRLSHFWKFFIGPFLTPAIFFILYLRRDKRIRWWLAACIPFVLDKASYHAWYPAHSGPATVLIVLVMVQCWRHMRTWRRQQGTGLAVSRLMVAGLCATIVFGNAGRAAESFVPPERLRHIAPLWESMYPAKRLRDDVIRKLERIPGSHLVFVKYAPGHCFCEEWVFNLADVREQRIVFARTYTAESDQALALSLKKDNVWVIEPDERPYMLARLNESDLASSTTHSAGHNPRVFEAK